jgi:disulfide bond formation protein DsbB
LLSYGIFLLTVSEARAAGFLPAMPELRNGDMRADAIAALAGAFGLAMVLGAIFFQYVVGVAPCEVCIWQRIPHAGAALIGLGGATLACKGAIGKKTLLSLTILTLALVAASGFLGIYHSGVEWRIWAGPEACTGDRFVFKGSINLDAPSVVRCDVVSWRFLGIFSLANLNALFSLGTAGLGTVFLLRRDMTAKLFAALAHRKGAKKE